MLEHFPACFLAFAAFVRTLFHMRVVGELVASLAAARTGLGAGGANQVGEWPLPRCDTGGRGAVRRAILTRLQRREMFFLALSQHVSAVVSARVTDTGAFTARLGALIEGLSMVIVAAGFVIGGETAIQRGRHCHTEDRDTEDSHGNIPPLKE